MNKEIIDSLVKGPGSLDMQQSVVHNFFLINGWTYIAIIELAIIVGLYSYVSAKNRTNPKSGIKKKILEESVDFNNIVNSAFHSSEIYKTLIVKCHPDRFPDDSEKNKKALEIFQLITKNKNDLKALEAIKERAINELGITF
ncbi:MAG: hypothetical protein MJZ17_00320 [Bacteroidales bacterium]|nr:hypothetical protein [Bacteroidales bacterium]